MTEPSGIGVILEAVVLVRVEDVMRELNAPETDWDRVVRLVNAASVRIEEVCGTVFRARQIDQVLDGPGGSALLDLGAPIVAVHSVNDQGTSLTEYFVGATTGDYQVLAERGQLYRPGGWGWTIGAIRVVATLGYARVPDHIQQACMKLCRFWRDTQSRSADLMSERLADYSYTRFPRSESSDTLRPADIPDDVMSVLRSRRRHVIG